VLDFKPLAPVQVDLDPTVLEMKDDEIALSVRFNECEAHLHG